MSLVEVWAVYAFIGAVVFSSVLLWAVRTRQFTELDRQRYIALRGDKGTGSADGRAPARLDRYTWFALVMMTVGVFSAVIWLAYKG